MLRRLALVITIISLVFIPLIFAPKTYAWKLGEEINTLDDFNAAQDTGIEKYLQDFCEKRQGNQMNLETWYSGKCTDDTFSGEGVGFSDIVILDLAEKISGKKDPNKTFIDVLKNLKDLIEGNGGIEASNITPEQKQLAIESARQELFNQNNGLIGQVGKMIGMIYQNQPASTGSYLAYVTRNLQKHKIIPQTLAASPTSQGVGFATFSPFLTIWMIFRNLAYLGVVIFFIVYGFMMMFRINLGQKTVISVQLAIPKLIVTLLIITFSYAIVGLMYDIMWVLITFIFGYLTSQGIITGATSNWNFGRIASGNTGGGLIVSMILNSLVAGPAAIFGVLNLVIGGVGAGIGTIIASVTGIGLIISLCIMLAVLISYGKLFFKLITSFLSILISLITGPIVLLGNAFPGSKVIGTWSRGIIANLSVFPITMLLLFFSYLLMVQPLLGFCVKITDFLSIFSGTCEGIFGVKNLVAGDSGIYGVPLIASGLGFNAQGLLALMGVVLLLMSAKYVDIVQKALNVPPFPYGSDLAEALKSGIALNDKWAGNSYKGLGPVGDKLAKKYYPSKEGEPPTFGGVKGGANLGKSFDEVSKTVK